MKKAILLMCLATIAIACSTAPSENGWIKVEGNKFVDPQGDEIVFRGLCFSDPVKLVSDTHGSDRTSKCRLCLSSVSDET